MKTKTRKWCVVVMAMAVMVAPFAQAANFTWDASGGAPLNDGTGNWNPTGGNNWFDGTSTYGAWGNTTTDTAIFGVGSGAAGTITVGTVNANGITFNAPGSDNYTLSGGTITLGGMTPAITVNNASSTISSVLAGSAGLTKAGSGTLTLSGANTNTGTTTIGAGTLKLQAASPLNTGRTYSINGGAVMNLDGGAIFNTSVAGSSTINGTGTLRLSGGTYARASGGGGTLTLALGSSGLIDIQAGATISTWYSSVVNFTGNQATLNVDGTINGNNGLTINAPALTGAGTIDNTGTVLNIGVNNGSGTFSGTIKNNASLTKTGAGTQTLSGSNTYTGTKTISGGTLRFASGALGTSGAINASGGTLEWLTGNTQDISSLLATTAAGITTLNTGGNDVTFANALGTANTGLLVKTGLGTLTLQAANNYTGTTTVNMGTLALDYTTVGSKLADGAALILGGGTVDLKNGASSHTEVVASTTLTAGTASSVTQSSGTSVLQMNSITPNSGTVNFGGENIATVDNLNSATTGIIGTWATVGSDWAINSGSTTVGGATVPGVGAVDSFIRAYTNYTGVTRLSSGTKAISNGTTTNVRITDGMGSTGNNTVTGTIAINSLNQSATGGASTISMANQILRTDGILMGSGVGALTIGDAGGTVALSGTLTPNTSGGSIIVNNNSSNTLTINSVIANNTITSLVKDGTGVLVLSGANTYTGGTVIQDGTIKAGATQTGSTSIFGTQLLTIANKATASLDLNGFNVNVFQLAGGGLLGGNVILGDKNLNINNANGTYAGILSGTGGSVTTGGSSMQVFTGLNTYTGVTTVRGTGGFGVTVLADGGIASGIGASSSAAANLVFNGDAPSANARVRYDGTADASSNREFTLQTFGGFAVQNTGSLNLTSTAAIAHGGNVAAKMLLLAGTGGTGAVGRGKMAAQITDSGTGANITGIQLGFANSANSGANWSLTNPNNTFSGPIVHTSTTYAGGTFSYASAGGTNAITFNQTTGTGGISYIGSTDKTMSGPITASALTTGTITLDASGTGAINYSNTGSMGTAASGNRNLILSGSNTGNNILAASWKDNTGGTATLTKNGVGT